MAVGLKYYLKRPFLEALVWLGRHFGTACDRPVELESVRNVLIVQFGGLGDVLRIFPVIEALSNHLPHARIITLTNHGNSLFELLPSEYPKCEHIRFHLEWGYFKKLWSLLRLRRRRFDLVVNSNRGDGMVECSLLALVVGTKFRLGFDKEGAGFLHTTKVEFDLHKPIVSQNLDLLRRIGVDRAHENINLHVPDPAATYADHLVQERVPAGHFLVCIHPWASSHAEFRAWPSARYLQVIRRILDDYPATVILLGGREERELSEALCSDLDHPQIVDLTGMTSLTETTAILSRSNLFIGNDSGLLHIADALMIPCIGVFGATSPGQVLQPDSRAVTLTADLPCRPCHLHEPLFPYRCAHEFACLGNVTAAAVLQEVDRFLTRSSGGASPRVG